MPRELSKLARIIDARLKYYLGLKVYLAKIDRGQVSNDEIKHFLSDILGFEIDNDAEIKLVYLPKIMAIVGMHFDDYRAYTDMLKIEDERVRASSLLLFFKYNIAVERVRKQLNCNKSQMEKESRVLLAFNECDQLTELIAEVGLDVDMLHCDLSTFARHRTSSHNLRPDNRQGHEFEYDNGAYVFGWKDYLVPIKNAMSSMQKDGFNLGALSVAFEADDDFKKDEVLAIIKEVVSLAQLNKVPERSAAFIMRNVKAFYRLYPTLTRIAENFDLMQKEARRRQLNSKTLKLRCKQLMSVIKAIETSLTKKATQVQISFDTLRSMRLSRSDQFQHDISAITEVLSSVQTRIGEFVHDWNEGVEALQSKNANAVERLYLTFERRESELSGRLRVLRGQVNDVRKAIRTEQQRQERAEQMRAMQRRLEQRRNRDTFLADRAAALQRRQSKVAVARKDKQAAASSSTSSSSSSSSAEAAKVVSINEAFIKALLADLKPKQRHLLQAIFAGDKKIKYSDVCHLIINHLGGEVREIGNGSSHKRIVLNFEYGLIVTSRAAQESTSVVAANRVVGTAVKPHGKAHSSGVLSAYNVSQLRQFFIRAGITAELVQACENDVGASLVAR